jgi:hypothetical protein
VCHRRSGKFIGIGDAAEGKSKAQDWSQVRSFRQTFVAMPITVKFVDGREEQHDADAAAIDGPLFVLYKHALRGLASANAFNADEVVMARMPDGGVIFGKGKLRQGQ